MDVLLLKLSTKFMRGLVAKIMSRKIYKKIGYKINIQLNDMKIDIIDGDVNVHINVDGRMNKTEFNKLLEQIDKE